MNICYLGAGTWGYALACLLADNGHKVILWSREAERAKELIENREHPKLPGFKASTSLSFTNDLINALQDADVIVESITSAGIRPVFETLKPLISEKAFIIITSKGIEQNTGLLLPEVISEVLEEEHSHRIGCLSGPSHAEEVVKNLPTSVVASAFSSRCTDVILQLFNAPNFRVYPNPDIYGVSFGAAMKNPLAIACGISDGLGFGDNTKAALMTRGLHEIRKLSSTKGCKIETLNGLSGMGDLCVTCLSKLSRNYRFGRLIAEGYTMEKAKKAIGMAVEGAYTCVSALQLSEKHGIAIPITEAVHAVIYEGTDPKDAVKALLQRAIKEEHL